MPRKWIGIVLTLILVGGVSMVGAAQEATDQTPADADSLGVSFDRIKYKLDKLPDKDEVSELLRLDFYVDVFARAPEIDYFQDFDLQNSPISDGVPMDNELLDVMRSGDPPLVPPVIDFGKFLELLRQLGR